MEGYEGTTVKLNPICPMCTGHMTEGFLLGYSAQGYAQAEWAEGHPSRSIWTGLKLKGVRRYAVATARCEHCGYLASYATRPLNDVQ